MDTALVGHDVYTFITGEKIDGLLSNYTVEIEFTDNYIFNGNGNDLAIWERGTPESIDVSVYDPSQNQWTSSVRLNFDFAGNAVGSVDTANTVNVALLNFDAWNLSTNTQIDKIRLSTEHWTGSTWICSDIAAIGGINSAPEPCSLLLIGLGGLFLRRRKT